MLTSLSNLGRVSDDVIKNSRQQTVAVLNNLQPILANVDSAKKNIVSSLELLTNYPFPTTVSSGVHGDYAGLYASVNLNLNDLIAGLSSNQAGGGPLGTVTGGGTQQPTTPTVPGLPNALQKAVPAPSTGTSGGTGNSTVPNVVNGLTSQSVSSPSGDSYTTAVLQGMSR
jgi:hypothetical protein